MNIKNIAFALGVATTVSAVRLQSQDVFDDVGDWFKGAAEDTGKWTEGAVNDAADWTEGAGNDIADWTEGAVNDIGDFFKKEGDTMVAAVTGVFTSEGLKKLGETLSQ